MPARAIWKAELRVGPVTVPVKLYSAVQEQRVHFRLLHARDHAPVRQEMVETAGAGQPRPVPTEEVRRGLQVDDGTLVILRPEELASLEPEPSRDIRVEELVEPPRIDLRLYDRPYFLGPDGETGKYFALTRVLQSRRRVGVARWVMRRKRYQGALYARGAYLVLHTLRHAEELVAIEQLRPPADREPDQRELALAEQLVAALEDRFDPTAYRDEYRDRVLQLVEAKAKGQVLKMPKPKPPPKAGSLTESLEASVRAARKGGARG